MYDILRLMKKMKHFEPSEKVEIVLLALSEKYTMKALSEAYDVNYATLKKWKKDVIEGMSTLLGEQSEKDIEVERLSRLLILAKKQLKISRERLSFLKRKSLLVRRVRRFEES